MAQRCHHYERAFEDYLRSRRIPYVAVDEARKTLLPATSTPAPATAPFPGTLDELGAPADHTEAPGGLVPPALKSFDFVLYGEPVNLLIDVKGRRLPRCAATSGALRRRGRLESWVTQDDVRSLRAWERLFGSGFVGSFVFLYWCDDQPPDGLFQEIFEDRGRWYAVRAVAAADYSACMRPRSPSWRTVDLCAADFERLSRPLCSGPRRC